MGAYLLLGGLVLAGVAIGRRRTEKAGLALLAGAAAYATVLAVAGWATAYVAGVTLAFAASIAVRSSNRLQAAAARTLAPTTQT